MCYVRFRSLNAVTAFRFKKSTEMSEQRCDALHLPSDSWEYMGKSLTEKKKLKKIKLKFANTNKLSGHVKLVNLGCV